MIGFVLGGKNAPVVRLYDADGANPKTITLPPPRRRRQRYEPDVIVHKMWDGSVRRHLWGHYWICELEWGVLSDEDAQTLSDIANHSYQIEVLPYGEKNPDDTGTVASATADTLSDTSKAWGTNEHAGKVVYIASTGEIRLISSNTATQLTIASYWRQIPSSGASYQINPALAWKVYVEEFRLQDVKDKRIAHTCAIRFKSTQRLEDMYFGHKEAH